MFLYCRSLTCGFLQHSITACIYFMPPHGPSRADLALMASLCKHAAVLPVVGKADAMTAHEAAVCCEAVQRMLSRPAEYVPGLRAGDSIDVYRLVAAVHTVTVGSPVNHLLCPFVDSVPLFCKARLCQGWPHILELLQRVGKGGIVVL